MNSNHTKKILLLSVLAFIVLASGCINLELEQKINRDGMSSIKTTVDMSGLYENFKEDVFGENAPDINTALSDYCSNFLKSTPLLNPYCTPMPEEYMVVAGGEMSLKDNPSFTFDGSTYRYDIKDIQEVLSSATRAQGQEITPENIEQVEKMAKAVGMNLKYIVEMPGVITRADIGEIKGNRVEMDFFNLYKSDHIYIESQETNGITGMFIANPVIGFGAIIILLVVVLFLLNKKGLLKIGRSKKYHGYDLNKIKKGLK
ncbi:MAG: hypothetical protein KKB03_01075 [Nanoarchaeota archaeon]|nr:hypothetical protein [Nanoarchaeota archaeon]MBU1134932.1 hypothetical protein [Nanoarchaeota archaeon]MBU2519819.1 hypothetical protein [Nanoarchaeota archaeon]